MNEDLKTSILDQINKMLKEIRSLSLFAETGIRIADKDEDIISNFRLYNCQNLLGSAQVNLNSAIRTIEKYASKYANNEAASKEIERMLKELLAIAVEHLELAKFNYAYYMEYRNNPDRSIEELMEAASKTEESLLF